MDFSQPADANIAKPYAAPGGVTSSAQIELEDGSLVFRNRAPGSFGVQLNIAPLDVDQITDLSFDFKASPDARVNWFFRAGKNYYGVHFTGPKGVRPGATFLGSAQLSDLPGGWKRAHIPLRSWLRSAEPEAAKLVIDEVLIGNWDNEGYLMAGIGGNGPGAWWQMDNLRLEKRVETAQFGPARFEGARFVLGARDLASFDFQGLRLQLAGVGEFADAAQFLVPGRGFVVPLTATQAALRDGQQVNWKLMRGASIVAQGSATFAYADLKSVPLPTLEFAGAALGGDMETQVVGWNSSDAAVELDDQTAATGARSLRLTNRRTASPFAVEVGEGTLDAAKFPVLTFAFRADDRLRADLNFKWDGKPYSIRFTDRDNPNARVAAIDAQADDKWHVATVNWLAEMKKLRADATAFAVSDLEFSDSKWLGNAKGVQWWLDDWRPAPLVTGQLNAKVVGRDLSGVKGVAFVFDRKTDTKPETKSNVEANLKIDVDGKSGLWWLHVRVQNGAGRWSETAHFPFVVGE